MSIPLHVLILEDEPYDVELVFAILSEAGYACTWTCVDDRPGFIAGLDQIDAYDIILADFNLPDFDGLAALKLYLERRLEIPFVLVSGTVGEELAIDCVKSGATDYVLKDRLSRLGPVVKRALLEAEERRARRRAESELRKLSRAVEQSPSLVMITDTDGRLEYVNPKYVQITGYYPSEVLGEHLRNLPSHRIPVAEYEAMWSIVNAGDEWRGELRNERKDGDYYWASTSVSAIKDGEGVISHFLVIEEDISVRKQAEEALRRSEAYFRSLIENISDVITLLDPEGIIGFESPSVERVLGYAPHELVGQNVFEYIHPDDQQAMKLALEPSLVMAESTPYTEVRFKHKDGAWHVLDAIGNNLLNDPEMRSIVVTSRDVTRRKVLEQQLRQAQKMEALGQLTAGIAHDFNNLLTAINGFAELMQRMLQPDDRLQRPVGKILYSGQRAADLVRQLLAFSRKQVIEPQILVLNITVTEMDEMLRRIIGEDITLRTRLAPDLWRVKADPTQIEQIIVNLAVNARDAMPSGGQLVIHTENVVLDEQYVEQHVDAQPGHHVQLTISDTGIGMNDSVKAHLFEPFFTTKAPGRGTGLGLATVYGIARQHGGHVWVDSKTGVGTTVKIYLPRTDEDEVEACHLKESEEMPSGNETILLVEDDPEVRNLVRQVLQIQGYMLLEAKDSQEALHVSAQHAGPLHLMLTDVIMPGMNGKMLAEKIVQARPGLKVLFMSGYNYDSITEQGVLDSGIILLQKPFGPADLARKVRGVLDS